MLDGRDSTRGDGQPRRELSAGIRGAHVTAHVAVHGVKVLCEHVPGLLRQKGSKLGLRALDHSMQCHDSLRPVTQRPVCARQGPGTADCSPLVD